MWKVRERTVKEQERISLFRRSVFAYLTTAACFGVVIGVLISGNTTPMAERIIGVCMSYAELMAMLYLGASVIDRSGVVSKLADRFGSHQGTRGPQEAEYPSHREQYRERYEALPPREYRAPDDNR